MYLSGPSLLNSVESYRILPAKSFESVGFSRVKRQSSRENMIKGRRKARKGYLMKHVQHVPQNLNAERVSSIIHINDADEVIVEHLYKNNTAIIHIILYFTRTILFVTIILNKL